MEQYKLPSHINPDKVFIVNRSVLESRFDPDIILYKKKTNNFLYSTVPLKSLLLSSPQYGANESSITRNDIEQPRYIRITDINEYGLLEDDLGATAETIEPKYYLRNNDILLARSGATVGKAYLHKTDIINYDCFFAGYMIRFIVNPERIIPEYLFTYTQLKPYKDWVKAIQRTAAQPNINAEEYKSLLISLPPFDIQNLIVDKISEAYNQKQQKEAEAKTLLDSIDSYLLSELGVTFPEKDNSLQKRVFSAQFSDIVGMRLDPLALKNNISDFLTGKYKEEKIKNIAVSFKSGFGAGRQDQASVNEGVIQIRPTNIDEQGSLKFDRNVYLPDDNSYTENDFIQVDDILFNNTNSQDWVGKTAILKEEQQLLYSNHITKITVNKSSIVPDYLWLILNSYQKNKIFYSICTNWNNQSGVGLELLRSLPIPLPPLEKQNEIANHIKSIREQAKQLQNEAKAILEQTKKEIESMILR